MLNYKRIGVGQPVVFLHGFLESSTMWDYFDLENAPFESILIDLPGHGKSRLSNDCSSIAEVADLVIDVLKTIGVQEFDVVGHSLGGYVAIEIHKKLNSPKKLVLFHSNFWEDDAEKKANRNRVIKVVKENKTFFIQEAIPNLFLEEFRQTQAVQRLVEEAKTISAKAIVLYSEMMRDRPNHTAYILTNQQQVYVIQGKLDAIIPCTSIMTYEEDLSHLYLIEACGHMGYIEQTNQSFSILKTIFSDL